MIEYILSEYQQNLIDKMRKIQVSAEYEVLVAGGGVSGIAAAIAAGREGANTLLIERNGFLGGTATAAGMSVMGAPYAQAHGFYRELCERLAAVEGASFAKTIVVFEPEVFKLVALEMLAEAGVTVMLYTTIVDSIVDKDGAVQGLVISNKKGLQAVFGKVTVDCTGDADVAYYAGAECQKGRERDGKMRPLTLIFRIGNVNLQQLREYVQAHPKDFSAQPDKNLFDLNKGLIRLFGFFTALDKAREEGEITGDIHYLRFEGGNVKAKALFVNTTRVYLLDGTDPQDLFRADIAARKQIDELIRFMRKHVPGCAECILLDTAANLGVRETRRIKGEFIFDEKHVKSRTLFPDRIAVNYQFGLLGTPMHSPDGDEGSLKDSRERGGKKAFLHGYSLPYRILLPKKVNSLLVAGRCISVTHMGDHWTRPMPVCMTTGHAAGAAAALAAKSSRQPRELEIVELQAVLRKQQVNLEFRKGL